jgi:flavodoxin/NAD-dependent dihydropyrimidine dehydrogenase PreA subunit
MTAKKNLIFCFSQTGNTKKMAQAISDAFLKKDWESEIQEIPKTSPDLASEADAVGIGTPVHYWTSPIPVTRWVEKLPAGDGKTAYVFTTYGHVYEGNALHALADALKKKGYKLTGGFRLPTVHNYASLGEDPKFGKNTPTKESLTQISEAVKNMVDIIDEEKIDSINVQKFFYSRTFINFLEKAVPLKAKISGMPGPEFNSGSCTGCGTCADVCSMDNIRVIDDKAQRGDDCMKCMRCVVVCENGALDANFKKGENMIKMVKMMTGKKPHQTRIVK